MREASDEEFLELDQAWPLWPYCPVKRPRRGDGPSLGFVFSNLDRKPGEPFKFYRVGLDHLQQKLAELPEPEMKTAAELVAEGWIVD